MLLALMMSLLTLTGCTGAEAFIAGASTGAALQDIADQSQDELILSIQEVNKKTNELNDISERIKGIANSEGLPVSNSIVKPEMIAAIKSLKGREKDPMTWIAIASVLANMIWAGRSTTKLGLKS